VKEKGEGTVPTGTVGEEDRLGGLEKPLKGSGQGWKETRKAEREMPI